VDDEKVLRIQRPDVDPHVLDISRKGEGLGFSRSRREKLARRAASGRIGGGDKRAGLIAALGLARWGVESSGSCTRIADAEVGVQRFARRHRIEWTASAKRVEGYDCAFAPIADPMDPSATAPNRNARFIFLGPTSLRRSGMHKANLQKGLGLSIPSGREVFLSFALRSRIYWWSGRTRVPALLAPGRSGPHHADNRAERLRFVIATEFRRIKRRYRAVEEKRVLTA
jgi:hypothetical protein